MNKRSKLLKRIFEDRQLYYMLLPVIIFYIIFVYFPLYDIRIAFKDYNLFQGIEKSPWVGFENFMNFFTGPYFGQTLKNTILINIYSLTFAFPIPILLALMMNEVRFKKYKSTIQTATYLPYFVSAVVVAGLVVNFLSPSYGIVNQVIKLFGGEPQYFLIKPQYFRSIYTIMNIWYGSGFGTIIYTAALTSIDNQLYEAATIDGAGKFRQILNISIPGIMPTIVVMLVMKIGQMLNVGYESIILLYQPATYETADVISTYVYRMGIQSASPDYGLATAVDLFNSIVALVLVVGANKVSNKLTNTGLW